jgi:hypothetical protein
LIVKYHFLENTFEVAAAFRSGGEWFIETDNQNHLVPSRSATNKAVPVPARQRTLRRSE